MRKRRNSLRLVDDSSGPVDLVLTDVVMPGMGGRELGERLALLRPSPAISFMSGDADEAVVIGEGTAFIQKPFVSSWPLSKVRQMLDSRNS